MTHFHPLTHCGHLVWFEMDDSPGQIIYVDTSFGRIHICMEVATHTTTHAVQDYQWIRATDYISTIKDVKKETVNLTPQMIMNSDCVVKTYNSYAEMNGYPTTEMAPIRTDILQNLIKWCQTHEPNMEDHSEPEEV